MVWNEICGRRKREKFREKPTQTSFRPPRNPHGVTETRTREPIAGGKRESNRLRHETAFKKVEFSFSVEPIISESEKSTQFFLSNIGLTIAPPRHLLLLLPLLSLMLCSENLSYNFVLVVPSCNIFYSFVYFKYKLYALRDCVIIRNQLDARASLR